MSVLRIALVGIRNLLQAGKSELAIELLEQLIDAGVSDRDMPRSRTQPAKKLGPHVGGKVYFARSGQRIKIGYSKNPWARVRELGAGAESGIELIGTIPGSISDEKELHVRFEHIHVDREWFEAAPELLAYIATNATTVVNDVATTVASYVATTSDAAQSSSQSSSGVQSETKEISTLAPIKLPSEPASRAREDASKPTSVVVARVVANDEAPATNAATKLRTDSDDAQDRQGAWVAYAAAYRSRYGRNPTRNKRINSQLKFFCERIPREDWVAVINHYVRSQNARYVAAGHVVGPMLADAEKLHTEALTGRNGTVTGARRVDREADRSDQYADMFARLEAEGANGKQVASGGK